MFFTRPQKSRKTKKEIMLGVIGVGMIGSKHVRDFQNLPDCQVISIADIDEQALHRHAEEFAVANAFTNYKDLLSMEEIDAVVICAPPYLHEEICIKALNSDKHVLCEKPMALSPRSAEKIVRSAAKNNQILASCSSRFRFSPTVIKAREMIDSGELGTIYNITISGLSRRYRPCLEYHTANTWGLEKAKTGGGTLMDWGMYDLNILFGLIGNLEIQSVDGFCFQGVDQPKTKNLIFDVEEHGGAMLRCKNGVMIYWERAWAAHMTSKPRIKIFGSKAGIAFDPLALTQDIFFEIYEDRSGKPVTIAPDMHLEKWDIHTGVGIDFLEAVRGMHPPKTGGEEVVKFLKIIHAVYQSHQKKQVSGCRKRGIPVNCWL